MEDAREGRGKKAVHPGIQPKDRPDEQELGEGSAVERQEDLRWDLLIPGTGWRLRACSRDECPAIRRIGSGLLGQSQPAGRPGGPGESESGKPGPCLGPRSRRDFRGGQ